MSHIGFLKTKHCKGIVPPRPAQPTGSSEVFRTTGLQQYIEDALETSVVPVARGIFYVFRDPAEQLDFCQREADVQLIGLRSARV